MEDLLEASIVCALVQLLDRIYREDGEIDLADLNTASGVIQRLLGSIQQVTELRMRARDLATESTERGAGFSEEIRLRIEERLKLL
ncbi:MAG: hypothetical protein LBS68_01905 [Puniceicoccales bacterium]|jgi:hypothetical protein|nr:hypothetical protein [Puniceicoccales bacterium]